MTEVRQVAPVLALGILKGERPLAAQLGTKGVEEAPSRFGDGCIGLRLGGSFSLGPKPGGSEEQPEAAEKAAAADGR